MPTAHAHRAQQTLTTLPRLAHLRPRLLLLPAPATAQNTQTPPTHPEALILTLALLRTRDHASSRRLLFALAPDALPDHPLPALGTLVYRLHHILDERWHQLVAWLAQQGMALEPLTTTTPYALVDGTGIGYAVPFSARFLRGAVVRQLRSHGKVMVVGYWQGASYGRGGLPEATLIVGDALSGYRARLLGQWERVGWLPVMQVRAAV